MKAKPPLVARVREWLSTAFMSDDAAKHLALAKLAGDLGVRSDATVCLGVVDGVDLVVDGFVLDAPGGHTWATRVTAAIWPNTKLEAAPLAIHVPSDIAPSSERFTFQHRREQEVLGDRASDWVQVCGFPGSLDWVDRRLDGEVMACLRWSFVVTHREVIARRVGVETDTADFLRVARLAVHIARAVRVRFTAVADAACALHDGYDPTRVVGGGVGEPRAAAGFVRAGVSMELCVTQGPWGAGGRAGDQWMHTEVLAPTARRTTQRFAILLEKLDAKIPPAARVGVAARPWGLLGALRDLPPHVFGDFVVRSNEPEAVLGRLQSGAGEALRLAAPNVVHADDGRSVRVLLDGIVLEPTRLQEAAALAAALARAGDGPYRTP